jgi:3-methylfumaryl-CoA hydratase
MLYNASLWNGHRIHFDMPYATEVEGYPGLVVAGPLMGDWLHQVVDEWLGDAGMITGIEYSNRIAAYVGETVTSGGIVTAYDEATGEVTLEVFVKNERDEVLTPGVITATLTVAS